MANLTALDIMNPAVITVPEDMTVEELSSLLIEYEITGAPVVDRNGDLVGVVSMTDITRSSIDNSGVERENEQHDYFLHGWEDKLNRSEMNQLRIAAGDRLVRDIMTPSVYTVTATTSISEIATAMISGRIHRLFVTEKGKVTGIIATLDMMKLLCNV